MTKKITERRVGDVRYELVFFEGDHVYVIYRWDLAAMGNTTQVIPEIGRFSVEKDARDFLDSL